MASSVQRIQFTVEEYYKMAGTGILKPEDRVELIHGEIFRMSPINSLHAGIVNFFTRRLLKALEGKASVCIQNPLSIDEHSEPQPDVLVTHFRQDDYRNHHPRPEDVLLLIEVSDATLRLDRDTKLPLYARAGIPECWIVNLRKKQIEIYRLDKEKAALTLAQRCELGDTAESATVPFSVSVAEVFG